MILKKKPFMGKPPLGHRQGNMLFDFYLKFYTILSNNTAFHLSHISCILLLKTNNFCIPFLFIDVIFFSIEYVLTVCLIKQVEAENMSSTYLEEDNAAVGEQQTTPKL